MKTVSAFDISATTIVTILCGNLKLARPNWARWARSISGGCPSDFFLPFSSFFVSFCAPLFAPGAFTFFIYYYFW